MTDLIWTTRPPGAMTEARAAILAKAIDFAARVAPRAEETDALRRLPDATVADIKASGLARIMQPAHFGGDAAPPIAMVDVLLPIAAASGATAWSLAQYISHNYMVARWPEAGQRRVWSETPEALISGILIPRLGNAERVAGGYRLSGRWPLVTGSNTSDWCMLSAMVTKSGVPHPHYFLVPIAEVTILDTWHAVGLKGSASNDVEVRDLFVPDMLVSNDDHLKGGPHAGSALHPSPIFALPAFMTFGTLLTSAVIGMVEAMLAAFLDRDRAGLRSMTGQEIGDQAVSHLKVAEATACLRAAQALIASDCDDMVAVAESGIAPDDARRTGYRSSAAFAGKLANDAAALLWDLSGARGVYHPNAIGRAWGDLTVAGRHMTQKWDLNGIEHGRVLRGLPMTNMSL